MVTDIPGRAQVNIGELERLCREATPAVLAAFIRCGERLFARRMTAGLAVALAVAARVRRERGLAVA